MPDRTEVLHALYGAYRLACGDTSGMTHFNLTVDGFWRSFFAAVVAAPAYAITLMRLWSVTEPGVDLGWFVLIEGLTYLCLWAAFPLVAIGLTRAFGLGQGYVPLIVAANWAAVLHTAAFALTLILVVLLPTIGSLFELVLLPAVLVYQWFVIRTALQTTSVVAIMFLLVDIVVSMLIQSTAEGLV